VRFSQPGGLELASLTHWHGEGLMEAAFEPAKFGAIVVRSGWDDVRM